MEEITSLAAPTTKKDILSNENLVKFSSSVSIAFLLLSIGLTLANPALPVDYDRHSVLGVSTSYSSAVNEVLPLNSLYNFAFFTLADKIQQTLFVGF